MIEYKTRTMLSNGKRYVFADITALNTTIDLGCIADDEAKNLAETLREFADELDPQN